MLVYYLHGLLATGVTGPVVVAIPGGSTEVYAGGANMYPAGIPAKHYTVQPLLSISLWLLLSHTDNREIRISDRPLYSC